MAEAEEESKQWYIVQTFSGYEDKAKTALEQRIQAEKVDDDFEEIYIPTETVVEVKNGKRKEKEKRFYNGYIFVKMNLSDQAWHTVKNTPKIMGFVGGNQSKPSPVPESEVKQISDRIEEGTLSAEPTYTYEQGDKIRVVEGNFKDFTGTIEEVQEDKETLRVFVEIFGRPTSVEFNFDQVEAVED